MVKDNYAMDTKDEDIVGQPNPVDIYVGSRLKLRRLILGISQKKMAEKLGITFQQVQKYENGINRMNESIQAQSPRSLRKNTIRSRQEIGESFDDPMLRQESIRLIKAYSRINNEKLCRKLLDLTIEMSLPK